MQAKDTAFVRPKHAYCYRAPAVQLGEFDLGGVLYHANYFHLYEAAREALFREHDFPYCELVSQGSHLALVESHQKFEKSVRYGEPLCVYLWITEIKRSSATFCYEITLVHAPEDVDSDSPALDQAAETTVHKAWTRQVFVSQSGGEYKAGRFPEKLLQILEQFS